MGSGERGRYRLTMQALIDPPPGEALDGTFWEKAMFAARDRYANTRGQQSITRTHTRTPTQASASSPVPPFWPGAASPPLPPPSACGAGSWGIVSGHGNPSSSRRMGVGVRVVVGAASTARARAGGHHWSRRRKGKLRCSSPCRAPSGPSPSPHAPRRQAAQPQHESRLWRHGACSCPVCSPTPSLSTAPPRASAPPPWTRPARSTPSARARACPPPGGSGIAAAAATRRSPWRPFPSRPRGPSAPRRCPIPRRRRGRSCRARPRADMGWRRRRRNGWPSISASAVLGAASASSDGTRVARASPSSL